jgi:hypothetical protein
MFRAPVWFFCIVLVGVVELQMHATDKPHRLFNSADETVVTYPTGRHWIFFAKPSEVYWLDNSKHSVFYARGKATFDKWLYKITHPKSHIREPWGAANARLLYHDDDLVGFDVAPDASLYLLKKHGGGVDKLQRGKVSRVALSAPLDSPLAIATSATNLYISDRATSTINIYTQDGQLIQTVPLKGQLPPDRFVRSGNLLYGMSFRQHSISRYLLKTDRSDTSIQRDAITRNGNQQASHVSSIGNTWDTLSFHADTEDSDFVVYDNSVYMLNPSTRRLTNVSFYGGGRRALNLDTLFGTVTSIAATDHGIVFADADNGNFHLLQATMPVSIYLKEPGLEEGVGSIYAYLFRLGLLPSAKISITTKDALHKALQSHYIVAPTATDIFCRLNDLSDANCIDQITLPEDVEFPDLELHEFTSVAKVSLPLSNNPATAFYASDLPRTVPSLEQVAKSFDNTASPEDLRRGLLETNKNYVGPDILQESRGTFYVPAKTLEVDTFFSRRPGKLSISERLGLIGNARVVTPVFPKIKSVTRGSTSTEAPVTGNLSSADGSALPHQVANWLTTIDYDPKMLGVEGDIAVVDFYFDTAHPLFKAGQFKKYNPTPGIEQTTQTSDGVVLGDPEHPKEITIEDHGTHVSGLIGGQPVQKQPFGINPLATVYGVQVDDFPAALQRDDFSIFNISLGEKDIARGYTLPEFKGKNSDESLRTWLNEISNNSTSLFVIAAGNDETDKLGDKLAGLGTRPNVITVSATDKTGKHLWIGEGKDGSNHGYPIVSLEAPGDSMVSGTYHNSWGTASGTSQATALVTGAASLLRGIYNFEPWQIKQRLVSTTTLAPWLRFNFRDSVGGLLDVARAVDDADKTVVLFRNLAATPCVGKQTKSQARKFLMLYGIPGMPSILNIKFTDVRRIHWDQDQHTFTIWYSEVPSNDNPNPHNPDPTNKLSRAQFTLNNLIDPNNPGVSGNGDFGVQFAAGSDCALAQSNLTNVEEFYNGFYAK